MKVDIGTGKVARIAGRTAAAAMVAVVALTGTPQLSAAATPSGQAGTKWSAASKAGTVSTQKRKARKKRRRAKSARVSWYGPGFYGQRLPGGGRLGRRSMVIAHRNLPFGTKVRFSYKGRSVVGIVKDRGPYVRGRAFDLGPGLRRKLRFWGAVTVKYRVLRRGWHGREYS